MEHDLPESNENGLMQSQGLLSTKLKGINRQFKMHASSLTSLLSFASGFIILWIYLLSTGQATTDLAQRYGLFGSIVTIILTAALVLLIIQMGVQVILFGQFMIRGNNALKQAKGEKGTGTAHPGGIVPYISNFHAFFKRYSKEKTSLVSLVKTFLFFNFLSGFYVIFLFTRLLDAGEGNPNMGIFMVILFLGMLASWLMNLVTSNKIKKEMVTWESLFPKLDEWAQSLEDLTLEDANLLNGEDSP